MRKRELLKALEAVRPGDSIVVMGSPHIVDEVAVYKKDCEEWRCLVYHSQGAEFALESEGGESHALVRGGLREEVGRRTERPPSSFRA